MTGVSEALGLARRLGIDPDLLRQVVSAGSASCYSVRHWPEMQESVRLSPAGTGGMTQLGLKDLGLALALGRGVEHPMPMSALATQTILGLWEEASS